MIKWRAGCPDDGSCVVCFITTGLTVGDNWLVGLCPAACGSSVNSSTVQRSPRVSSLLKVTYPCDLLWQWADWATHTHTQKHFTLTVALNIAHAWMSSCPTKGKWDHITPPVWKCCGTDNHFHFGCVILTPDTQTLTAAVPQGEVSILVS